MDTNELNRLRKALEEVVYHFKELREAGISDEIMEIYIAHKTKLSVRKVKEMLRAMDEFYNKLLNKTVMEQV